MIVCAYDLTISTRLMQSLYYSHKSSKNGNHTLESYFRRTKVVQYRFYAKIRFANNLVLFAYIIISLTDPSCQ